MRFLAARDGQIELPVPLCQPVRLQNRACFRLSRQSLEVASSRKLQVGCGSRSWSRRTTGVEATLLVLDIVLVALVRVFMAVLSLLELGSIRHY